MLLTVTYFASLPVLEQQPDGQHELLQKHAPPLPQSQPAVSQMQLAHCELVQQSHGDEVSAVQRDGTAIADEATKAAAARNIFIIEVAPWK